MKTHNYGEVVIVREEDQRKESVKSFSDPRKLELLEGRIKKLEVQMAAGIKLWEQLDKSVSPVQLQRIEALEKKLDHLAYVVDRTF